MTVSPPSNFPRRLAFDILERVSSGSYADRTLDAELRRHPQLDPRDRRLVTELVYGISRLQGRLDYALTSFCHIPLKKLETRVLLLLRLGAYQLLCLDRVPDSAAVNTTVLLAHQIRMERATRFVNGVLRALARGKALISWPDANTHPQEHLQHVLSLPEWLAKRWVHEFGAERARQLAAALLEPPPFSVRVNTLKVDRDTFLQAVTNEGHLGIPTAFAPEGVTITSRIDVALPGDTEGWYQVQDEASMLVAHLLLPQPGELLLDACAAPGGKTTHLAALSRNQAQITAIDLHLQRLRLVEQGAVRLGCERVTTYCWDLSKRPPFLNPASYDGALVDAPCSGLGVLRRNPEARWRLQPNDIAALATRQQAILSQAASLVKPGGRIIYSVCTITPEETDHQITAFLKNHPDFRLIPLNSMVPENWLTLLDTRGCLRTWPACFDLDGFFVARLERN